MGFLSSIAKVASIAAPIVGGFLSGKGSESAGAAAADSQTIANRENIAYQKEFAQQGIRWKVADATKAGLHPLAALGANTHSFTPSVVGTGTGGKGSMLSEMGQGIANSVEAIQNLDVHKLNEAQMNLIQAQTEETKARTQAIVGQQTTTHPQPPSRLLPSNDSESIKIQEPVVQTPLPNNPGVGAIMQKNQYVEDRDGGVILAPSEEMGELYENDPGLLIDRAKEVAKEMWWRYLSWWGNDKAYRKFMRNAPQLTDAQRRASMMYVGEPGTGKYYLVHRSSAWANWALKEFDYLGENQ